MGPEGGAVLLYETMTSQYFHTCIDTVLDEALRIWGAANGGVQCFCRLSARQHCRLSILSIVVPFSVSGTVGGTALTLSESENRIIYFWV